MKTLPLSDRTRKKKVPLGIIASILLILGLFSLGNPYGASALVVEGVVFSEDGPTPGAVVYAYPDYPSLVNHRNYTASEAGDKEGFYRMELPTGAYYLMARAEHDGKKLFSYHGVNPVNVNDAYRWLPFFLVEETAVECRPSMRQGIQGTVAYKHSPINAGVVSTYGEQDGKFRGIGLLTNTIDEAGSFSFDLEPGSYVVIARKKQDVRGIGPVHRGDLFCYPSGNPITVEAGQRCSVDINCYPRDELDQFLNAEAINPQGRRQKTRRQASLFELQLAEAPPPSAQRATIISGRITDPAGKPMPGLVVTAYPAQGLDLFQMHVLRLITDNITHTDQDGNFRLEMHAGGKFYLAAREKMGEAPNPGEYYGLYEGTANHSLVLQTGETRNGIDLVVERIMPPLQRENILETP